VRTGLIIEITPFISNRGLIEMDVRFENSVPIIRENIGNNQRGVGSSEESATTYMVIPDGATRVIGGLIGRDRTEGRAGVPFLSQIPYLGFLFGSRSRSDNLRNMMFFVTATIVEEQPTNDLLVEPINEEARISMAEEAELTLPPQEISQVPEELRPYLESIRPEPVPMPFGTDQMTTPPLPVGDESTSPVLPEDAALAGRGVLTAQPYVDPNAIEQPRMGGALSGRGGAAGPSGAFGSTPRPVVVPRPPGPPEEPPATTAEAEAQPEETPQEPAAGTREEPPEQPAQEPQPRNETQQP
jgi:hypothetical protein